MSGRKVSCCSLFVLGCASLISVLTIYLVQNLFGYSEFGLILLAFVFLAVLQVCFCASAYLGNSLICFLSSFLVLAIIYGYKIGSDELVFFAPLIVGVLSLFNFWFCPKGYPILNTWIFGLTELAALILLQYERITSDVYIGLGIALLVFSFLLFRYSNLTRRTRKCTDKYKARVLETDEDITPKKHVISFTDNNGEVHEHPLNEEPRYGIYSKLTIHANPTDADSFYIGRRGKFGHVVLALLIMVGWTVFMIWRYYGTF